MLRQAPNNISQPGSSISDSVLTVRHQCEDFPDSTSSYTFTTVERDAIISAATNITSEQKGLYYYFYESPLQKSVTELCNNAEAAKIIMEIISQTQSFFSALDANKKVDARIYSTGQLLDKMEALTKLLKEDKFEALINQLYGLSDKHNYLRVLPLMLSNIHNQAALMKHFMMAEILGHDVAYKIAQNEVKIKTVIMQPLNAAESNEYNVREIIVKCDSHEEDGSLRDKSLMASILTPVYKDGVIPAQPTLYITWTGTYNQSTFFADLQVNAGEESYRHAEQQIMEQVMQALSFFKAYCNKPFRIVISGHSLGGALSQLLFHSLQRQLAASIITDNDETTKADNLFLSSLRQSVKDYQQDTSIGKLVPNKGLEAKNVSEISLAVWNSTGVLQAVEDHSNELAPFLKTKSNILHSAYIGHVGGDAVQVTGQGTILSDIENNSAQVAVLKIEPNTLRASATVGGLIGSVFAGALILSSFTPLSPFIGAGIGLTAAISAFAKKSIDAHTMKHFSINFKSFKDVFSIPYRLFTSHSTDGSLNQSTTAGFLKVKEEISRKSMVTNSVTQLINSFGLWNNRSNSTPDNAVKPQASPGL